MAKPLVRLTRPPRPERRGVLVDGSTDPIQDQEKTSPLPPSKEGEGRGGILFSDGENESEKLQEVQALSSKLGHEDKKKLLDFISLQLLAASDAGLTRDQDQWAVAVYEALVAAIGTQGGGMAGPLPLKRMLAARASWAPVEGFARAAGFHKMRVPERLAAYRLLATILVERCQQVARAVRAPLSGKLVANSTGELGAMFDAAFPGYMRAGIAGIIFKRHITANEPEP